MIGGHENAAHRSQRLLSRDFILLFFLALFSNCYLSIYYCFEQWLDHVNVDPGWRGVLLGALFGMVMLTRPLCTVFMLKVNRLPWVVVSLFVCSGVLFSYQWFSPASPWFEWALLGVRLFQGVFLAVFSTCVVSILVSCIPPGQSARGFALFSLTTLLPYALIPTAGELLLPILGGEPRLFACTGLLIVPCLVMTAMLAGKLRQPEVTGRQTNFAQYRKRLLRCVTHSGLGFVYLSLLAFALTTSTAIFFIKGLCSQTGGNPASFFFFYTVTIMVVRVLGSRHLDSLPCYRIVPTVCSTMALALLILAWGPAWAYIPATILYGASLSLLYPLMASVIYNRSNPDTRSINSNLMMLMFDAGALFAPMIGGLLIAQGLDYHGVITGGSVMMCFSAVFFLLDRLSLYLRQLNKEIRARRRRRGRT